jgi:hypothetical protein
MYRRNVQKLYVDKLIELLKPGTTVVRSAPVGATSGFTTRESKSSSNRFTIYRQRSTSKFKERFKISTSRIQDKMSKYHLLDLINRISEGLDQNRHTYLVQMC